MGFFQRLLYKLNSFMYGRYGSDELNRFLLIVSLVIWFLSFFPYMYFLGVFALAIILWTNIRMFSRNYYARRKELDFYLKYKNKIKSSFSLKKQKFQNRKTHKYYKCENCKANLRVPKGRGKIEITCPKCKSTMIRRT